MRNVARSPLVEHVNHVELTIPNYEADRVTTELMVRYIPSDYQSILGAPGWPDYIS